MRRAILWFIPLLVPLSVIVLSIAWQSPYGLVGNRAYSTYRPGDCLQTPVPAQLPERWSEPPTPENILMISEVGNAHYRYREWGTRFSRNPQWYENSYKELLFATLDDTSHWAPIPCPEQGPDPEELSVATSLKATAEDYYYVINPNGDRVVYGKAASTTRKR